jgi:hypothetical protein
MEKDTNTKKLDVTYTFSLMQKAAKKALKKANQKAKKAKAAAEPKLVKEVKESDSESEEKVIAEKQKVPKPADIQGKRKEAEKVEKPEKAKVTHKIQSNLG